jgi:hypothetical protein
VTCKPLCERLGGLRLLRAAVCTWPALASRLLTAACPLPAAGGCFWGIELAYQRVPGVVKTTVGYTDGHLANPTYEEVCSGRTGHTEVVQCTYDPNETSYEKLLDLFFSRVDPTTLNRQGNDRGTQYRCGAGCGGCAVLCCAVLCCAVLCCAVLCCAVLCCAVLQGGDAASEHAPCMWAL